MPREALTLPVLSDTMQTGQLSEWLKQPGDPVKKGEAVAEVESDKAIMEVEAFKDGFLDGPLAATGQDIPVGEVIAYIADSPAPSSSAHNIDPPSTSSPETSTPVIQTKDKPKNSVLTKDKPETPVQPEQSPVSTAIPSTTVNHTDPSKKHLKGLKISPYARGLAQELDLDPSTIRPAADGTIRSPQVIAAALQAKPVELDYGPQWHYKLFTPTHRAIADNMTATLGTPTFRVSARLPMDKLLHTANEQHLSLTLLLARALALSVKKYPQFNAAYTPMALAQRKQVDVGIAMDIPGSLLTPVLRNVVKQSISSLSNDWNTLKAKIKARRISASDYKGATIYLSNLGMFQVVTQFEAIVPPGAAAILAVGAIQEEHAVFTLSCDHRVVYGADAARFLEYFSQLLEKPDSWATN